MGPLYADVWPYFSLLFPGVAGLLFPIVALRVLALMKALSHSLQQKLRERKSVEVQRRCCFHVLIMTAAQDPKQPWPFKGPIGE